MPTPQQIRDDILFWLGSQEREHMLFMVAGLVDNNLKAQAQALYDAYTQAAQAGNTDQLVALASQSQALKRTALEASKTGWIGWLFPSFYEHIIYEIDYALARISRDLTPEEEACFWTKERAGDLAVSAHLLDPTEHKFIEEALKQEAKFAKLSSQCQNPLTASYVQMVRDAAIETDTLLATAATQKPKSVVHPILLEHVKREGVYLIGLIEQAKDAYMQANPEMNQGMRTRMAPNARIVVRPLLPGALQLIYEMENKR